MINLNYFVTTFPLFAGFGTKMSWKSKRYNEVSFIGITWQYMALPASKRRKKNAKSLEI